MMNEIRYETATKIFKDNTVNKDYIKCNNNMMEHMKHTHNTLIMEQIKYNTGITEYMKRNTDIMKHIKNTVIMEHVQSNTDIMEHIKSMAAKTDAMERVTINPVCSLSDLGPSLMNANAGFLLDSGASMSVTGDFRAIYSVPQAQVTLPDGSQLLIVGVGTIETERFSIPNVYLVAGLKTNLISVSQLDKRHGLCCAFFHNHCRVINSNGELVGGAILQENGLYVLSFLKVA
ncbi:hypothetical protein E2562_024310 [Oryza meyeriana var. granulata]|uniref:Retrovirus-related Pol polyprotein from transposon TNT 1-94-like beta-barrel domain-containing protein n=1 Tax=Oryza meyeriana var. granulata TaxID=110450 RepID=A0A6G1C8S8_9ORYZ|nr:hypothetical protein E2562_024310 [Oryza meyeriana var. granulata]